MNPDSDNVLESRQSSNPMNPDSDNVAPPTSYNPVAALCHQSMLHR